jgi:hypothetical protein
MEKVVVEEIKVGKRKEKEDKWAKWTVELGSITKRITRKFAKKRVRA